jgi:hypothetical protein
LRSIKSIFTILGRSSLAHIGHSSIGIRSVGDGREQREISRIPNEGTVREGFHIDHFSHLRHRGHGNLCQGSGGGRKIETKIWVELRSCLVAGLQSN